MAAILKSTLGIDSRWNACLQRHFPHNDTELGEALLTILAYVVKGAPPVWQKNSAPNSKGKTASTYKPLHEIQKKFERHQGELASVVLVYKSWSDVPKRERLSWCQQNSVNNTSMSQVQDVVLDLKREKQSMARRRSLRSADETATSKEENVLERLSALLMEVFPDCFYVRWHTKQNYLNCVTTKSKLVDFSDACLFEELNSILPDYVLSLPNVTSRDIDDDFNPASEICLSLVVSENIAQGSGNRSLLERFPKIQPHVPVKVTLPSIGDAVVLRLAGNRNAKEELQTAILQCCSQEDMLLSLEVHEPDGTGAGWKLEIHCPAMYEKKVSKLMAEKVRVIMEDLESNAESVLFGDPESKSRLLVGAGGQVKVVPNGQHLVMVHLMKPESQSTEQGEFPDNSFITSKLKEYGKICEIERTGDFPEGTLWGAVWFEFRLSALKACGEAEKLKLPGGYKLKLVHVETNTPLYTMDFLWMKTRVVKNQMQLYFLSEKDLNQYKRIHKNQRPQDGVTCEFDRDELKATLTSTGHSKIYWEETYDEHRKRAFPKFINYSHHLQYEAGEEDFEQVQEEFPKEVVDYYADPEMLRITFAPLKPGDPVVRGKMQSFCTSGLLDTDHNMGCMPEPLCDGEFTIADRMYVRYTLPKEAYNRVEDEVRANKRRKGFRSIFQNPEPQGDHQNPQENGGEPNNRQNNQNPALDNGDNNRQENQDPPMGNTGQNNVQANQNPPMDGDQNDRQGNPIPAVGNGDQNPRPENPFLPIENPVNPIIRPVLINDHLVAMHGNRIPQLPPEIVAADEAERQANIPLNVYKSLRAKNHPTGDLVEVTLDVLEEWEFENYRIVDKLLKPNIVHVRGDVLGYLLAEDAKTKQPNFVKMMNDTDTFIQIMKQKSAMHIYGTFDNVAAAKDRIKSWKPKLQQPCTPSKLGRTRRESHRLSQCENKSPLCRHDIRGEGFRLSLCGHLYCHPCFRDLVKKAMDTKHFPIRCSAENCSRQVLMVDIEASFARYNLSMTDLYMASMQSVDNLQTCLTLGCPMKYHPCKSENPAVVSHRFRCPLCKATWCMSCQVPFHKGYNCAVFKARETIDAELREWLDEKDRRRLCPKCLKGLGDDRFQRIRWVDCQDCNITVCMDCLNFVTMYAPMDTHQCPPEDRE